MKAGVLLPLLLSLALALEDECPIITESQLGSRDALSSSGLVAEGLALSPSVIPNVRIFDYNIVCFAAGCAKGTYRELSVVVQYEYSGIFCACSPLNFEGFGNATSQFEFTCSGGSWMEGSGLPSSTFTCSGGSWMEESGLPSSTFTNPSDATLKTQARRDCSFCLRPGVAASLTVDNVTHCADCNASCLEPPQGLGFCTNQQAEACCNFYDNNACTASCPGNISDASFNCRAQCPVENLLNGQVDTTADRFDGSTANYSCDTGFNLQGPSSRTCQENGTWSNLPPTCIIVDCGNLAMPSNGHVTFSPGTVYQSVATYRCNTGYTLSGRTQRTCLDSGKWSNSAPSCNIINCGNLPEPANGQITFSQGTVYQSVATYSCNSDYTLNGEAQQSCLDNGEWSGSAPSCIKGSSGRAIAGLRMGTIVALAIGGCLLRDVFL